MMKTLTAWKLVRWLPFAIAVLTAFANGGQAYRPAATAPPVAYTWKNVQIVAGGFITGIVAHPAQRGLMYTRTDIGGAYRWDSAAARWIPLTDWVGIADRNYLGIESIGLDPSDPQRLYLAAGTYMSPRVGNGAILVSNDQGRTFKTGPMPFKMGGNENGRSAGERLAVDPNLGAIVYFGSRSNGLWKSIDHGAHWAQVTSFPVQGITNGVGVIFIAFEKNSGSVGSATPVLYAGVSDTGTHLYRSTDAGATWTAVPGQPQGLYPNHGVFGPDGNLYISYGDHVGPNGMTNGAIYRYLPPGPSNPNGVWTDITPPPPSYENTGSYGFGCVVADPRRPGVIMASTMDLWSLHDDIFRSLDGGNTWIELGATSQRDSSLSPYLNWGGTSAAVGNWIGAMAIDPYDSDHALYGTGATIWATNDLTRSDTGTKQESLILGGTTHWRVGALDIEETAVTQLISPPAGAHLVSGLGDINGFVHDDLAVSPRGGMQNAFFITTRGLDFAEKVPSVIVRVGNANGPAKRGAFSTDGGVTWSPFASEPATVAGAGSIAVSADGSTFVWAPSDAGVASSANNGATWSASSGAPARRKVVADRVNPRKFYVFDPSASSLYVSTDRGATFTKANNTLPDDGTLMASYAAEGDLWISSNSGLYHSTDSGARFTRLASVQESYAFGVGKAAANSSYLTLYLSGKVNGTQAVFRSTDAGATWIRINDDQHQYGLMNPLVGDPRIFGRVYAGTNGRGIVYGDSAK